MSVLVLLEDLQSKGIKLILNDEGGVKVLGRRELLVPDLLERIRDQKQEIIACLRGGPVSRPSIQATPRDASSRPALSFAQERLWFIDRLGGGSVQYNMPGALRVRGAFDLAAAEQALARIVARHESLRTVFVDDADGPRQWIRSNVQFALQRVDLQTLPLDTQTQAVRDALDADTRKPFDLGADLMLRASFLQLAHDDGVLLFNMHHIASDGWSIGVLMTEFVALYAAFAQGAADPLPPLDVQYADYAQWQRQWLEGAVLESQLRYWEAQLADLPMVHGLPLDRPRPMQPAYHGAMHTVLMSAASLSALREVAQRSQATLFMMLHAAFALVVSRYANSADVVIGTPVANRLQRELEPLVGFFANTLVLRADCAAEQSLGAYLAAIRRVHLDAQANQDVPFEALVERLRPVRSTSHAALFQIMLNMATAESTLPPLPGLSLTPVFGDEVMAKFDLTLDVAERDGGWALSWIYDQALFDAATIARMGDHLAQVLVSMGEAERTQPLSALTMLSAAERSQVLDAFNATDKALPTERCLNEVFEAQAARAPDAPALIFEGTTLRYGDLDRRANQLAHALRERGVGPDVLVGLCVERSLEMVVGILGILKAGGAYVPLDPSYPPDRLAYMLEDSAPAVVLVQRATAQALPASDVPQLVLEGDSPESGANSAALSSYPTTPVAALEIGLRPDHLAYVIYTSGSTGHPKGVQVEHRQVVNLAQGLERRTRACAQPGRRLCWAAMASYAFDASVQGWVQLMLGHTLLIVPDRTRHDADALRALLRDGAPDIVDCTPTLLESWLNDGLDAELPHLVVGGEPIGSALWQRLIAWQARTGRRALNVYGPTECCVDATCATIEGARPQIGRPWDNTRCYLLDAAGQPVPIGVIGELYIGGAGVARGYLNRPELTAERFVRDPFHGDRNARMYRTGDLGRWLPDGSIEHLGRNDFQVKIRGLRIELGEIEQQLMALPEVTGALVKVWHAGDTDARLIAYVTSPLASDDAVAQAAQQTHWQTALRRHLPDYMLPTTWIVLAAWPLLPSGKIDRKALPTPDTQISLAVHVAPRTPTEIALAQLWAELLKQDAAAIGAQANFFALGGHSLLSVRLLTKIRARWDVELGVRDVFEASNLATLAAAIDAADSAAARPRIHAIARDASSRPALSFAQERLWFIDRLGGGSVQYNMPGALRVRGAFDLAAAEQALARIVARHESLRTVFVDDVDGPRQWIRSNVQFALQRVDLQALPLDTQTQAVRSALDADTRKPFDLGADLMLRASFLQLAHDDGVLLFNMHHIASDGWSIGVLMTEFVALYAAFAQGAADPLPPLAVQYADYAQWQRQWLEGAVLESQLQYWEAQLADLPMVHGLPLDRPRPMQPAYHGAMHTVLVSAASLSALREVAQRSQATLFMMLHAAFALVVSRYANSADVVIGTPVANRLQRELEPLVGFFANTLVLRADCAAEQSLGAYLAAIRRVHLDAQANQDVPFEALVERLRPVRSTSHAALFQIMLNMATTESALPPLPGLSLTPVFGDEVMAKFDLTLDVAERDGGWALSWVYDQALFDAATIARMGGHLAQVLASMGEAERTQPLSALTMLSASERLQALDGFNATDVARSKNVCLHEMFEAQATRAPDAPALIFEGATLCYGDLDRRANQLAHALRERGVGPDVLVGLCVERSLEMVVGILGILKAGGAYVPLDPSYPPDRLAYMLEDSAPAVVLVQDATVQALPASDVPQLVLDGDSPESGANSAALSSYPTTPVAALEIGLRPDHLAYVIYTSGSTGHPKGVQVEHRQVVNLAQGLERRTRACARPDRRLCWAAMASYAFDASVQGWVQLMLGHTLLIVPDRTRHDADALRALLRDGTPDIVDCTPTLLESWLNDGLDAELPHLVVGGEPIGSVLWQRLVAWQARTGRQALNVYGPTECCVDATCAAIEGTRPQIGRPWDNTRCYLLDAAGQPVPIGVTGELYIGGAGVARGYLNRPELTTERFVRDPFQPDPAARMYRTGDLGRWLADGQIEHLGRNDFQVKIRGLRIELGEIEQRLMALPKVTGALVTVWHAGDTDARLIAYVTSPLASDDTAAQAAQQAHWQTALRRHLPDYMLPTTWAVLAAWPLLPNGKIDRKALPQPQTATLADDTQRPVTPTQRELARLWRTHLRASPGLDSGFFELGGHSLMAARLLSEINSTFQVDIALRQIFSYQTVRSMASHIDTLRTGPAVADHGGAGNIVTIKSGSDASPPVFLVHPVGGSVFCYAELSRQLAYPGTIYGIEADESKGRADIGGLAERYLSAIENILKDRRYILGGWSVGGLISYEMARQSETKGKRPDVVFLIDSIIPSRMPVREKTNQLEIDLTTLWSLAQEIGFGENDLAAQRATIERLGSIDDGIALLIDAGRAKGYLDLDFDAHLFKKRFLIAKDNAQAALDYAPTASSGRINLVTASESSLDASAAWSSLACGMQEFVCEGSHFSLTRKPHVVKLAAQLDAIFSGRSGIAFDRSEARVTA